ncbi:MAG: zinc ABC transporter substrate-binding protein [Hyphomicrobiales bacterium]|nr:zinc ABC transporter substrate-binding protein [Hyphomicrobiales bacterium]
MRLAISCLATILLSAPVLAAPKVIASIVPVHSIVAAVMGDIGNPELLLSGKNSEHTASLSPQQLQDLGKADLVFMIGSGLEHKLAQVSGGDAVGGKTFTALSEAAGIKTLPVRQGGTFEVHEEHEGEENDDHDEAILKFDPHVWLDPENAKAMANAVTSGLSKADPENAKAYEANAAAFVASLDQLTADITAETKPIQNKPFVVFHDAYQYFEKRFGLTAVGSISDISAAAPSAKRLNEIRSKLEETKALCVFREPQFDAKYVTVVLEGSKAKPGVLDPIGSDIAPGPKAYAELLTRLAKDAGDCLKN